mmetsp:Transcript_152707/g.489827  ORF Transcript_152707/g.489827 Transcript_152707/m.489827 type:complete len:228 (-) Transcript_152707:1420-2103(-)
MRQVGSTPRGWKPKPKPQSSSNSSALLLSRIRLMLELRLELGCRFTRSSCRALADLATAAAVESSSGMGGRCPAADGERIEAPVFAEAKAATAAAEVPTEAIEEGGTVPTRWLLPLATSAGTAAGIPAPGSGIVDIFCVASASSKKSRNPAPLAELSSCAGPPPRPNMEVVEDVSAKAAVAAPCKVASDAVPTASPRRSRRQALSLEAPKVRFAWRICDKEPCEDDS